MASEPTTNDRSTVNLVVLMIGLAALVALGGCIVLRAQGKDVSDLVPIVTLALGALGGLLANTKSVDVGGMKELADAQQEDHQHVVNLLSGYDPTPPATGAGEVEGEQLI